MIKKFLYHWIKSFGPKSIHGLFDLLQIITKNRSMDINWIKEPFTKNTFFIAICKKPFKRETVKTDSWNWNMTFISNERIINRRTANRIVKKENKIIRIRFKELMNDWLNFKNMNGLHMWRKVNMDKKLDQSILKVLPPDEKWILKIVTDKDTKNEF